ncbi:COG3437 Response regulator containing a CheY-like receiver domain and an HD-GYP domain [Burkholderiaceae bacterium]
MKSTVLCVDDEPNILAALRRMLSLNNFKVLTADSGKTALELLASTPVDVVISDMHMPEMNGAALLAAVKEHHPDAMRILLTGNADTSSAIAAVNQGGIYRYLTKPWVDAELVATIESSLELIALKKDRTRLTALTEEQNVKLNDLVLNLEEKVKERTAELTESNQKLRDSYIASIKAFSGLLGMRDESLLAHSRNVAELSFKTARTAGLDEEQCQEIYIAGLLHDIGKLSVSDRILQAKVFELPLGDVHAYENHAALGAACLKNLDDMKGVAQIIRAHHEHFNGQGFPDKLAGDTIPLGARIVAIAEAYEELTTGEFSTRPKSSAEALSVITKAESIYFCPVMVSHFVSVINTASL